MYYVGETRNRKREREKKNRHNHFRRRFPRGLARKKSFELLRKLPIELLALSLIRKALPESGHEQHAEIYQFPTSLFLCEVRLLSTPLIKCSFAQLICSRTCITLCTPSTKKVDIERAMSPRQSLSTAVRRMHCSYVHE